MKPKSISNVSAIVPITNYFQHRRNINNIILACVSKNIELILVLDKESRESHRDLINLIVTINANATVIQTDSGNPGGARNIGLESASGVWVTFWDCDDEPQVDRVIDLISTTKSSGSQVLVGSYQIQNLSNHRISSNIANQKNWEIQLGLNPGIWRFVFRRDVISEIRFPELKMGEDQIFLQRALATEPKIMLSEIVTYVYRTNVPNQLTSKRRNVTDLVSVNLMSIREYDRKEKYSMFSKTLITRQLITLCRSENLGVLARVSYLAKASTLLARNPVILLNLLETIRKSSK